MYAGVHLELGRRAAIKVLLDQKVGEERFWRECEGMGRLTHPGIVQTYEAGVHEGRPFLAMELVDGRSLKDVLATTGPWPSRRTAELGVALSEAMAHVHAGGLLHRDLKPENILIDAAGQARITDFGLVRGVGGHSLTATGTMVGTPAFMPPEQAEGEKKKLGPPADVYGLGATLFAVLTGVPPFEGASPYVIVNQVFNSPPPAPSSLQPGVDPGLEAILLRCLAKEPEERYPDAQALADVLESYLAGEFQAPSSASRRSLVAILSGLLVLALSLGGFLAWRASRPSRSGTSVDPEQVSAAWRDAQGEATKVAKWLERYEGKAGAALVREAKRELASLTWRDLADIGSTEDDPSVNELGRLLRYRALAAWVRDHALNAPEGTRAAAQERLRLWRAGVAPPVLALLEGRAVPKSTRTRDRRALPLRDGRVLTLGKSPDLKVWDLSGAGQASEISLAGEKPSEPIVAALDLGEDVLLAVDQELVRVDSRTFETRERLSLGRLAGRGILALPGGGVLVFGELQKSGPGPRGPRGGWTVIPTQPWPEGPVQPSQTLGPAVRAGLVDADRGEIYLAGGSGNAGATDYFLRRYRWAEGELQPAEEVRLHAAGYYLRFLPNRRILVGLNRSYAVIYEIPNLSKRPPLLLSLSEERDHLGGLGYQCLGSLALPNGGVLVACDPYKAKKNGWLAYFDSDQLASGKTEPLFARWIAPLGSRPLSLTPSRDGSLLFLGTRRERVAVLPGFKLRE